ncbi:hypothetical protein CR513_35816, partial [Mucuna pruriens]
MCERHERNRREERHVRHDRREKDRREELDMRKCEILPFLGNCKPKIYIHWELKVEDYAMIWWTTMLHDMRRDVVEPCKSWYDLKRLMRKRFVSPSCERDLHNKL